MTLRVLLVVTSSVFLPAVGVCFTLDRLLPLLASGSGLPALQGVEGADVVTVESGSTAEAFRGAWEARRRGCRVRIGRRG